jgi:hypothetical protein
MPACSRPGVATSSSCRRRKSATLHVTSIQFREVANCCSVACLPVGRQVLRPGGVMPARPPLIALGTAHATAKRGSALHPCTVR